MRKTTYVNKKEDFVHLYPSQIQQSQKIKYDIDNNKKTFIFSVTIRYIFHTKRTTAKKKYYQIFAPSRTIKVAIHKPIFLWDLLQLFRNIKLCIFRFLSYHSGDMMFPNRKISHKNKYCSIIIFFTLFSLHKLLKYMIIRVRMHG